MLWTFTAKELSAGHYYSEARRYDGRSLSRDGGEDAIGETIQEAYMAELALGTHEFEASYDVTRSFLWKWSARRNTENPNSWVVTGPLDKCVIYNAETMLLRVALCADVSTWQGRIAELAKPNCGYFHELVRL
ncbi:hypothetical protein DES53_102791 [Roseimicrobium gellanilyticum]|uniref:Uncharacterized protein n=1 Tax=Roseimicrobium gellanilyticum TaxID=748857 RepID=A0A366HRU3_9BACT|nr:hypothetical protein [Roseimicrobium gellanilyticum]RBP46400.1 hypothetical protein DES53_102791 [Roseimicrobium gellanilyticum]